MTGYQLHVRTFTLHTVLKTVADSYKPPNPPSVDVRPAKISTSASSSSAAAVVDGTAAACIAPIAGAAEAMDVDGEGAEVTGAESTAIAAVAPAVVSSLVRPPFDACIPEVVELLMEDLFGESAAAKEVSMVSKKYFVSIYGLDLSSALDYLGEINPYYHRGESSLDSTHLLCGGVMV